MVLKQSDTGGKIVTKCIDNALRFRGSKFVLTHYVCLRSWKDLEIYVYDNFKAKLG